MPKKRDIKEWRTSTNRATHRPTREGNSERSNKLDVFPDPTIPPIPTRTYAPTTRTQHTLLQKWLSGVQYSHRERKKRIPKDRTGQTDRPPFPHILPIQEKSRGAIQSTDNILPHHFSTEHRLPLPPNREARRRPGWRGRSHRFHYRTHQCLSSGCRTSFEGVPVIAVLAA